MSHMAPAQFEMSTSSTGPIVACKRPGCDWWEPIVRAPLTEVVALAREHVEEAHRG